MSADAEGLIEHLRTHYPGADFAVYMRAVLGFNLQRKCRQAGIECMVVHAADVSTSDKERRRKTDKVDAQKLARALSAGELKAIDVSDETLQKERKLIRYRSKVVRDIAEARTG